MTKNKPIRMCIGCKRRYLQSQLNRFQVKNKKLIKFSGFGRSFYICNECIEKREKKIFNILKNKLMVEFNDFTEFKEMIANG